MAPVVSTTGAFVFAPYPREPHLNSYLQITRIAVLSDGKGAVATFFSDDNFIACRSISAPDTSDASLAAAAIDRIPSVAPAAAAVEVTVCPDDGTNQPTFFTVASPPSK